MVFRRAGDPEVPLRRGAALAVSADGSRYSLLEAPLHLAETLAREGSAAEIVISSQFEPSSWLEVGT